MAMEISMSADGSLKVEGDAKDIKQIDKHTVATLEELAEKYYAATKKKLYEETKIDVETSIEKYTDLTKAKVNMIDAEGEAKRRNRKKSFNQLLGFGAILAGIYTVCEVAIGIRSAIEGKNKNDDSEKTIPTEIESVTILELPDKKNKK